MHKKLPLSVIALGFAFQANLAAQTNTGSGTDSFFRPLDLTTSLTQTGSMDLDRTNGDLSYSLIDASATRARPIQILGGVSMIPSVAYRFTELDFDNAAPLGDEGLHSASIQALFIKNCEHSRWLGFGWTRAEIASDFQGIASEDFTFDFALGAGYQFSEELTLGFGVAVVNLNGDTQLFPGINVDWTPSDNFNLNLFGPNLRAKYDLNENWYLTLTGEPGGGEWNISDDQGRSRTLDLDSYLIGLNTNHRLTGNLWLSAGLGYAVANEVAIRGDRGGDTDFRSDMDSGAFARIGLTLLNW